MKKTIGILWQRMRNESKTLKIQAKEYERRLDGLNGEAGRLREMQSEYIPREVFDRTVISLINRIEVLEKYKDNQEGKSQLRQWIPWVIAIAAIATNYFKK